MVARRSGERSALPMVALLVALVAPTGAFEVVSLAAGPYRLWASKKDRGSAPIDVEAGVSGLTLVLR